MNLNCTLPFKSSLDNSRYFLTEVTGALSEDLTIIDSLTFDKAVDQLEQESIKAYNVSGKPWIRDITQNNLKAIPNPTVLDRIDEKRKELGLYEKQLSGNNSNLGEEFTPIPEDNQIIYKFRLINALESDKVRQPKLDNLQGFINDISKQGVSNQQIDILKDTINKLKERNQPITKQDLITELLVNYSYGVEVNVAYAKTLNDKSFTYNGSNYRWTPEDDYNEYWKDNEPIDNNEYWIEYNNAKSISNTEDFTLYYSDLTVPGGTNYREIELRTPGITPSITGHAQFSTKEGIGWWRVDDEAKPIENSKDKALQRAIENDNFLPFDEDYLSTEPTLVKTRRLLELQSDLFQKGRDKIDLISILSVERRKEIEEEEKILSNEVRESRLRNYANMKRLGVKFSDYEQYEYYVLTKTNPNKFLQLLNKDNQWVTFFVKSFIQDSAKRGYEKVVFPSGNTASKIEGHQTLEDFKKQKEDRIKYLEEDIVVLNKDLQNPKKIDNGKYATNLGTENIFEEDLQYFKAYVIDKIDNKTLEIDQLRQELERVDREGFGALKPIYNFYENTVTNVLKKQGYNPTLITDEYGNTWNEVIIDRSRDLTDIMFQLGSDSLSTEITPELKSNLEQFAFKLNPDFKIEVLDDLLSQKGVNGIAQIKDFTIQLQKGKEGTLSEEISHFLIELMKDDNPLKKTMRDEVTRTRLYKKVVADYKKIYGNDIDRLKRETMAKLVSLYLTDKELFKYWTGSDSLVENVIRWIKDFFRWVKGETTSIGAFIKSAEKIINLDISGLYRERSMMLEDMYSLGDFVKEATILTTVGNVDTKYYPKVFINLSDTVFKSASYPWKNKGEKSKVLMGFDMDALGEFYKNVEFTQLGLELKDKAQVIENLEFYTSLPSHPNLIERLSLLFPGVEINFVNREVEIFDEQGNPMGTTMTNPVEDLIENNKDSLFIDNKPPYAGKDFKFKLYQESKIKQPYEPFLDKVKRKDRLESQKSNIQTLLKTLKGADQPTLTKSIKRAFSIITSESKEITRLEQRLGKQLIEEEFSSLFRDEGDLLLPTTKAAQGKQLLDKIEKYEELLTHFVGTLEAMTEFFRRRNNADYEDVKKRIASGEQKDIDVAIQELALVTKMGNKWKSYIDDLREVTKNVPNTDILNSLLGELLAQIESTKLKSRDLSVKVIASKLAPYLDSYNVHKQFEIDELKERLAKAPEAAKVEIQKSIDKLEKIKDKEGHFVSAEDIVKILNGETEDISPLTMWVKVLHNSSDPLIGTLFVHLEKIKATVSVEEIAPAQRLGQFISDEEAKSGLTSKEWQDKILYLDDTLEYENGKMVPKKAWTLLHPYMNEWKRDEKQYEVRQAKEKWLEVKNNNSSSKEEVKKAHEEYIKIRDDFDKWLTINWHREYKPEFYTKYDALLEENKELFEEIREEQSSIYDKIRELSDNARMEEGLSLRETNRKILALRNELKEMKRPTYSNGDPKVGKDLEKALFLQRKAEIDREFYEYKPDVSKFRVEFQVFLTTLLLSPEIKDTLELKLIEGKDNFVNLYKYAKEKNLIDVIEWLDNNTVTKFHQDWYNQRKEISDQIQTLTDRVIEITGVDNKSKLGDLWEQMFNLTSHLRDEDNVFDGIQSTPEIQKLVKEIDEEIEEIKRLTREESKEIKDSELKEVKKQIRDLVSKLDEIQSKDVTDSYKDAFNEMITRTGFAELHNDSASYMWVQGLKITDFITRPDFHKTLRENPDHKFTKWFYDNHFLKTKFTPEGEFKRWTPTYIWHKIEPVNSEYILLSPSHKYSNQTVREKWHTEKIPLTFNERLNKWNPKSEEFQNPEYRKLFNSTNPKDVAASRILKQVTDYHLNTQASTTIAEGNIGYVLPYIKKQVYEEGYLKSLKKDFFDSSNRFEEGAGNYDEQASKMPGFKGIKDKFLAWWRNQEQEEESKTDTERALRVAVPFTKYHEPDVVSKDVLMSVIRFSASTKTADKLMKSLPIISLIENSMVTNSKTKNRLNALRFGKENIIYGINQQEEVGKFAENTLRTIRKINTIGSLGFNIPNVVKNNLQGRLQNMIGAQFGDWSSNKAMTKASLNFRTSYAHYLSQAEKPLEKRDKDYHIITWLDPSLDSNIFNNLSKGATLKNLSTKGIMAFNEMMEFSISVNLMYARLYHVQVKNDKGEQKSLYDIITSDEVMGVEPGWKDVKTGRTIDMDYMMETRLAYKTVVEYVQGRVSNKTFLSTTTIGQAVLYFKNWLIPMLRRRFDKKRANYMMGEDFEGYWNVFFKSSLNLFRDILTTGRANWHAMTPREQREYLTAVKEIGVMMATLAILSLVFGFEADDPDKFKKLKKNSFAENYAILMIIQAKNETEALSAMPFFNLEESFVPPVLTEGVKWLESPTIGLSIIDNTWKLTNSLYDLVIGSPDAYYQKNMPQFDIEKGDTKFFRHLLKITQFDDILINEDPEQKIRSVISNIKR